MSKVELSKVTKDYRFKRNFCFATSMVLNFAPLLGCVIYAMISGRIETTQKLVVGSSVTVAIVLMTINALCKLNLRSPVFIIVFGLMVAFFKMQKLILGIMFYLCVVTVLDEFLLQPCYKSNQRKLIINKEYDKREGAKN